MEERNIDQQVDKMEQEIMLPGFRFHPTDEELVGFYLKRKIQQRPLSIELIKQLDIYKYDPWDLPKLASTGEKEWYFYCPRDRKYRNSARPNRVTGAGFWKATGTDRPIYSSEGNKCIGLKKSLVFYKGRAAKGIKTDWMMHEFRLPSLADASPPAPATAKRSFTDKTIPANDSWAICRIFKKTNSTAQRALSNSWVSPFLPPHEPMSTISHDHLLSKDSQPYHRFNSHQNMSPTTENNFNYNTNETHQSSFITNNNFPHLDFASYKLPTTATTPLMSCKPSHFPILNGDLTGNLAFSPLEALLAPAKCSADVASMFLNMSSLSASAMTGDLCRLTEGGIDNFCGSQEHCNGFSSLTSLPQMTQVSSGNGEDQRNLSLKNHNMTVQFDDQWSSLPASVTSDAWKPSFVWDSSSCSSEMMSSFSTNKC